MFGAHKRSGGAKINQRTFTICSCSERFGLELRVKVAHSRCAALTVGGRSERFRFKFRAFAICCRFARSELMISKWLKLVFVRIAGCARPSCSYRSGVPRASLTSGLRLAINFTMRGCVLEGAVTAT